MILKELVRADYKEFIETDLSVPSDLRTALKSNERVPLFIDRVSEEIRKAESVLLRRGKKMDRVKIKLLVHEMTKIFIHLVKTRANENYMSEASKQVLKTKLEGDELIQKLDEHGNADFSEELGVIIGSGKTEQI
jgi:hypothetical protein